MTQEKFKLYRHRIKLQAELARQTGDPVVFEQQIETYEPKTTASALRKLTTAFRQFRIVATEALPALYSKLRERRRSDDRDP